MRDFYGTVAQVLPVVILALVWESRYFEVLRARPRATRENDPINGVRFWTLPRVRVYSLVVASAIIIDVAVCLLVLAGVIQDNGVLRGVVLAGVIIGLMNLLYRIWVHVTE